MVLTKDNFSGISRNNAVLALVKRLLEAGQILVASGDRMGQYVCSCDLGTVQRINK